MIIFVAMIIPFITAFVLWYFFRHYTKWWEFFIPFAASILFGILLKLIISFGMCSDTEYWTGWIKQASYYEDWKETVTYIDTESYTDSDGNTQTRSVTRTRTDYHPPYWEAIDSNGFDFRISKNDYASFVNLFKNQSFKDLHRDYCCWDDGDMYYSSWPGTEQTMEVVTTAKTYQNRVAHSNSVFNFQDVDPKEFGLFEYPKIDGWYCPSILGSGLPNQNVATRVLDIWNAKLGASKQVRIWILVFHDKSLGAGYDQENYWKGSNKNELVLCVGVDSKNVLQWGHVFSWTEREDLKVDLRNYVNSLSGQPLDLVKIIGWIGPNVEQLWQRKNWHEFEYLSVEPPTWAVVLCFALTLCLNAGISVWLVKNEYNDIDSGYAFKRIGKYS